MDVRPEFTIYKDARGEWRWRLRASNGKIIAESGEGYTERNDARESIERLYAIIREGAIVGDDS